LRTRRVTLTQYNSDVAWHRKWLDEGGPRQLLVCDESDHVRLVINSPEVTEALLPQDERAAVVAHLRKCSDEALRAIKSRAEAHACSILARALADEIERGEHLDPRTAPAKRE
jgi:hypothetical protein